jgi:hypothetical protein
MLERSQIAETKVDLGSMHFLKFCLSMLSIYLSIFCQQMKNYVSPLRGIWFCLSWSSLHHLTNKLLGPDQPHVPVPSLCSVRSTVRLSRHPRFCLPWAPSQLPGACVFIPDALGNTTANFSCAIGRGMGLQMLSELSFHHSPLVQRGMIA